MPSESSPVSIRSYDDTTQRESVIALWESVFGYDSPHNEPSLIIDRKLAVEDDMMFVALLGDYVVGTIMVGYDGHRGWIYSLAVLPKHRGEGTGSALVRHAEHILLSRGCVKINLQILESNSEVAAFYETLGYQIEPRVSMGKRLGGL